MMPFTLTPAVLALAFALVAACMGMAVWCAFDHNHNKKETR